MLLMTLERIFGQNNVAIEFGIFLNYCIVFDDLSANDTKKKTKKLFTIYTSNTRQYCSTCMAPTTLQVNCFVS